jgi:transcriptional regulator with XRE-family HTH domain
MKSNSLVDRIRLAVPEQRQDLDLSLGELARPSGVSRATVTRLEAGRPIDVVLLMRIAVALLVLELARPPGPKATLLELDQQLWFEVNRRGEASRLGAVA